MDPAMVTPEFGVNRMGVKDERSELTPDNLVGTCLALLVCLVSKRAFVSITRCTCFSYISILIMIDKG